MANLNFRPRPIDINRAIPIFTDAEAEELDDRDYTSVSGVSRGVPKMPTGMEAEDEEEAHIQEAIKRSLKQWESEGKEIVDIPTPKVKIVKDYDDDEKIIKPFIRPQVYIKWKDYTPDELDQTIEYDMDSEDENFLNQINANKKILSEAKFEYLIDRFEKETDKNGDIPSFELVEQLIPFKNQILQIIYNYWIDKRKKFKIPLNYRFLKPPDPDDPSPYKAFRPRTEEKLKRKYRKNDQTSLVRMKQLRQEMERARMLLEMIKKRERLKKERIQIIKEILEFQLNSNLLNNSNEIKFFKKKGKI
jgi:enhancer of polycomb-like protein